MRFASDEQLNVLQSTDEFLVDGTFKVVPEIFYQLYIIHAVYRQHVVPVIYALLHRKTAETYQRLINEILKFAPCWNPRLFMLDFEQASINALKSSFPTTSLSGCFFHLKQSFHRKLQVIINSKVNELHEINSEFSLTRRLDFKTNIKTIQRSRIIFTR